MNFLRNTNELEERVKRPVRYMVDASLLTIGIGFREVRTMFNILRQRNLVLYFSIIAFILCLCLTDQPVRGQSSALQLITTEYGVSGLDWSPDSERLLFHSDETTRAYVRKSGVITSASSVVPKLLDEEFNFFNIYGDNNPLGSSYSISPDNRYVVYVDATPIERGEGWEAFPDPYPFFLGDRQQRLKLPTGDQLTPGLSVYWNTTSTAFIVIGVPATEGELPVAFLIGVTTNFTTDLATTITRGFSQFVLGRRSYNVTDLTPQVVFAEDGHDPVYDPVGWCGRDHCGSKC